MQTNALLAWCRFCDTKSGCYILRGGGEDQFLGVGEERSSLVKGPPRWLPEGAVEGASSEAVEQR
jgi:hypothetical protein